MTQPAAAVRDPSAAPSTVRTASLLYVIRGVLDLIGAVLGFVLLPQAIAIARQQLAGALQGQDTGGVDLDSVATATAVGSVAVGGLLAVAFGVLTIVFARKLLRGRNWTRITLLVFAVLSLPGLVAFGGPGGIGAGLLSAVGTLVAVAGAVLTFLPDARPWFRRSAPSPA